MTRTTNARLAGFAFLFYIAVGIASLVLSSAATSGDGIAARLANIAQHAGELRLVALLSLSTSFAALILGTTLYSLTREQDADLALLALACRIVEAIPGLSGTLGLLWLTNAAEAKALDPAAAQTLATFLLRDGGGSGAIFFAVASLLFSWLLLRGRLIPASLAWLGVLASLLLVLVLPLRLAGLLGGVLSWVAGVTWLIWLPMLVFEVTLALWLMIRGVATPQSATHGRSPA